MNRYIVLLLLFVASFVNAAELDVTFKFNKLSYVPAVAVIYWPEDKGLDETPVMDHYDGDFTQKVIVGSRGSVMSLRNSDTVGHTIYVKDKKQKVDWRLDYMPPNSTFEQELYWQEDVFVELKCKLHRYMSGWAGSISSRYYTVVEFDPEKTERSLTIKKFPEKFTQIKIWIPRFSSVEAVAHPGEKQEITLFKKRNKKGSVRLHRH